MSENLVLGLLQASQTMGLCLPIKRNKGRQKIEMKKIEKKSNLMVTFSKRRRGFFNKSIELGVLCGSEIAVVVQSPGDKIYNFGTPSTESVLHRFYGSEFDDDEARKAISRSRFDYADAERRLKKEKESEMDTDEFWWNNIDTESINNVEQLEQLLGRLQVFRSCFVNKADSFQLQSSSSDCLPTLISLEEGDNCGVVLEDRVEELKQDTYEFDDVIDLEKLLDCDIDKLFEGWEENNFSGASGSSSSSTVHNSAESFGLISLENKDVCGMEEIFKCLEAEKVSDTSGSPSCFSADRNFGLTDDDSCYMDNFLKNLLDA